MTFRRVDTCILSVVFSVFFLPVFGFGQNPPPASPAATPAPASPVATPVPDYPDPRTFTIGVYYWMLVPNTTPDVIGGKMALDYGTLYDLGDPKRGAPGLQLSIPITRTGELKFEISEAKGDGNQTAPADLDVFGQTFSKGDVLSSQYQIIASKIYLDDLLFPHKFPVAKFRLKSLWEFQYIHMKTTVDAPALSQTNPETAIGTKQILLPTFGIAAEYAIARHVLLRADGSGFGIPHGPLIWDAGGTVSFRQGAWEIFAGGKALHFKSSPNSTEYVTDTLTGAFAGVRWHWSF